LLVGATFTARLATAVTDAAGNPLAAEFTWTFTTPFPRFAYTANRSGTVSIDVIDSATGQLRHWGYVLAGDGARSVTVDPSGRFACVANSGGLSSGNVTTFRIDQTTGALSEAAPAVAGGNEPFSIVTLGVVQ
jgi:6-phosphogluconolactonase (cycloisomerase 2 family)